jgi:hypothetical protein
MVDVLFDTQKMSGCLPSDFDMRWYLIILKVYCRKLPDAAAELAEMCNQDRRCGHMRTPEMSGIFRSCGSWWWLICRCSSYLHHSYFWPKKLGWKLQPEGKIASTHCIRYPIDLSDIQWCRAQHGNYSWCIGAEPQDLHPDVKSGENTERSCRCCP